MDDHYVARRGSQGDDWHWEDAAPDSARADKREGSARRAGGSQLSLARALGAWRAPRLWAALAWAAVAALPGRLTRAPVPGQTVAPQARAVRARPRVAIPWSKIAWPRPRMRMPRPHWKAPRLRRAWKLPTVSLPKIPRELQAPLALFAGLGLAAVLAVVAVIAVAVIDDDNGSSGIVDGRTETAAPETPVDGSVTPAPSRTGALTETPSPAPQTTAPAPRGEPALAFWSNKNGAWWFDNLSGDVAQYEEGQYVPFMVRWDGAPGQTYNLSITYDCATGDAFGAIDYLSGLQTWGPELIQTTYGPGRERPDAAVPAPDTPDFDPDDDDPGVFALYGGTFPLLPSAPAPGDNCGVQRTITMPVRALGGTVILLGSGHLATASVYGPDEGASSNDPPFGMRVTLEGIGNAQLAIFSSAIADVER